MKSKAIGMFSLLLIVGVFFAAASAHTMAATSSPVSPGPAPDYGDGVPDGNQFIQPDAPGIGPAPNSGDGVSDGSGF